MEQNRLEDKLKIKKAIKHMNECLRYAAASTVIDVNILRISIQALEKQIPYKLTEQDEDTGVCKCGRVTEIIDSAFYCRKGEI
ncbi:MULTISPECIES: hypothetical protein [unclassified Clostridium]|uniref:hypothetical protein n=1 Tax=unclassified Clostridium TaxID=2614128 RepID=UPI0013F86E46|nr:MULTISPECIES: hypothetical protein [unclassified Clostridium]NFR85786.1 hypothetical protein [Clostridium botulinum]NFR91420.1 hypothetical protein [Clostridium botulinum]NFT99317.1 hypothetical protein [Clostridium botulinum]